MLAMKCITVTETLEPFQMSWIGINPVGRLKYNGELSWNGVDIVRLYL